MNTRFTTSMETTILAFSVFLLGAVAALFNLTETHFVGNNYIPMGAVTALLALLITRIGLHFYPEALKLKSRVDHSLILFIIIFIIAFASNGIQYTPFHPIDQSLILFEHKLSIHTEYALTWMSHYPSLKTILTIIYRSLDYQIPIITLFIIWTGNFEHIKRFYFLLLMSVFIGFVIYYFFPTTGPASNLYSPYFLDAQYETGKKFIEIHSGMMPSTLNGGLIAMPSFHIIWGWLCVYCLMPWKKLCSILIPINILLTMACVLLGWHYVSDVAGAFLVLLISHSLLRYRDYYSCSTNPSSDLNRLPC